jgi:MerR family transcriptional regulator, redox-sensitive transcriptional activator SoxR
MSRLQESNDESLSIGEVARLTGRAPSAIRYYEQVGLLGTPRRVSGKRRYAPAVLRTLAVVETAQRAGLSLGEIGLLLSARPSSSAAIERLRQLAEQKLPDLRAAINRAELVRNWLQVAARCCCPSLDDCPLFDPDEHGTVTVGC